MIKSRLGCSPANQSPQVKSKYFLAVANYHRGLACESESKYGEGVSRLQLAEIHAKEANKLASSFASTYPTFTTSMDSAPVSSEANQSGGIVAGLWGVASAAGVVGSSAGTSASVALLDATRMLLSNVTDKKNLATKGGVPCWGWLLMFWWSG